MSWPVSWEAETWGRWPTIQIRVGARPSSSLCFMWFERVCCSLTLMMATISTRSQPLQNRLYIYKGLPCNSLMAGECLSSLIFTVAAGKNVVTLWHPDGLFLSQAKTMVDIFHWVQDLKAWIVWQLLSPKTCQSLWGCCLLRLKTVLFFCLLFLSQIRVQTELPSMRRPIKADSFTSWLSLVRYKNSSVLGIILIIFQRLDGLEKDYRFKLLSAGLPGKHSHPGWSLPSSWGMPHRSLRLCQSPLRQWCKCKKCYSVIQPQCWTWTWRLCVNVELGPVGTTYTHDYRDWHNSLVLLIMNLNGSFYWYWVNCPFTGYRETKVEKPLLFLASDSTSKYGLQCLMGSCSGSM